MYLFFYPMSDCFHAWNLMTKIIIADTCHKAKEEIRKYALTIQHVENFMTDPSIIYHMLANVNRT